MKRQSNSLLKKTKEEFLEVAKVVLKWRYFDDFLKSLKSKHTDLKLIKDTEVTLKKEINMDMKGWSMSAEKNPVELTEDGTSIKLAGMT